jgi:hypothetical protein
MPALIIGPDERKLIAELIATAPGMILEAKAMMAMAGKDMTGYRDMMKTRSIDFPVGYHACYCQERQPAGLFHHISLSVDRHNKLPSPEAVEMILEEFGLAPLKESQGVWVEDIGPGAKAVNILQLVK